MTPKKCARTACQNTDELVFKHRDLGGLYCLKCALAIIRANNDNTLFSRIEVNPPQPGDVVLYHGLENVVRGVLAERQVGPLMGNPRYRVVDTVGEMEDPEAGRWIGINDVLRFDPNREKE